QLSAAGCDRPTGARGYWRAPVAHVLVSKYCDHTPLIAKPRSLLVTGSRSTARPRRTGFWWLGPLQVHLGVRPVALGRKNHLFLFAGSAPAGPNRLLAHHHR